MATQTRPLKILHLIHGLTIGGAEIDLVNKSAVLVRDYGYDITICCLMRRGELAEQAEAAGIKVIGPVMRHRYDITAWWFLRRLITTEFWDVVHTHIFASNLVGCLVMITIPHQNRPVFVAAEHALAERWASLENTTTLSDGQSIAEPRGTFALWFDRFILQHWASLILVPSVASLTSYVARGIKREKLAVISNTIDIERFLNIERISARKQIRAELGIPEEAYLVGTVSRLQPFKGLQVLLEAVAMLPVYWVIIGDGPCRPMLEAEIQSRNLSDRIKLLGTRSDIPAILASLDLFAFPSYADSFGISVAEALLMKVPVITTNAGGIPEVTNNSEGAYLVQPGNVKQLADGINWMMHNPQKAQEYAQSGYLHVLSLVSPDIVAKRQHNIYQQLVDTN
ncbi:MAG: glycosyltransferase [Methanobacteriota archaeon]|nr:MAG: glycosyltransferase [Euryarchaeota archaeon]